jgi:lysylphosphatidylglycerol synthetase-like protein (DUF2156 family)
VNIWDPFHPVAYFLHGALGIAGILGAIVALALVKGSRPHIFAGRIFAIAAAVAATTAIVFSFARFAPMAIASAVMMFSVVGSAILAHRKKTTWVATGEFITTTLMGFVLLWLLYGVVISVPLGGFLWIPPLVLALVSVALLVNDIRFIRQPDAGRESKRLGRHLSRMALAFAIAVHEPTVVFSDDLNIHPSLAFYGPLVIWPAIFFFFRNRIRNNSMTIVMDNSGRRSPFEANQVGRA